MFRTEHRCSCVRVARWMLVALLLTPLLSWGQEGARFREDSVKAAFLYRFTGYVDWPSEALATNAFTIAVLGSHNVARELERVVARHTIKGLPVRAREVKSAREAAEAQVLYVGAEHAGDLRLITQELGSRPVLLVTDRRSGLDEGGAINFLLVDQRVRFEISIPAARRAGLKVGAELLSVAARVRGALRIDGVCSPDVQIDRLERRCGLLVARR